MSTIAIVNVPAQRAVPRGAQVVGWLYDVYQAFAAYRRVRAEQARLMRLAKDREAVMRMARDVQNSDPGLASDLFAAAIRDCKWG